ncbi:MAG: hypothetical protein SFY81_09360 [Verrucomicrobiota bacterium]|nr:hypothetical protein [Verrucomicrobiota bacterium]
MIAAGQIEQALLDNGAFSEELIAEIEQWLLQFAVQFIQAYANPGAELCAFTEAATSLSKNLQQIPSENRRVKMKIPEGFAFYTLYPEQYMISLQKWVTNRTRRPVTVIGLRSIGTTLSAIAASFLRMKGWEVTRLTLRPFGHPYSREVTLPSPLNRESFALILDEGPGASGSSMAAAAAALVNAGFSNHQIFFFPSHGNSPGSAATEETLSWWRKIERFFTPLEDVKWKGRHLTEHLQDLTKANLLTSEPVVKDVSNGEWRYEVYPSEQEWPAVPLPFERTKYLIGSTEHLIWKFTGFAFNLDEVKNEAAGVMECLGFQASTWIKESRVPKHSEAENYLSTLSAHLMARTGPKLPSEDREQAIIRLQEMLYWNLWESLGAQAADKCKDWFTSLNVFPSRNSYVDGRMAPWEWRVLKSGVLIKVNERTHVQDHSSIGPQSILWDVAGLIIEWKMKLPLEAALLKQSKIQEVTTPELVFYLLSYTAFRIGQTKFTHDGTTQLSEKARQNKAYQEYCEIASGLLNRMSDS